MGLYVSCVVYLLNLAGFWDFSLLKETIYWFAFAGAVTLGRSTKADPKISYVRASLVDSLKLVIIIEFLVAMHTFALWIELLTVPFATLLFVLHTFTETKKEHDDVRSFLGHLLSVLGLIVLSYVGYRTFMDLKEIATLDALKNLLLPPTLSIAFLPFLILAVTYFSYENAFRRMMFVVKDPNVQRYAKWQALRNFGFNRKHLQRWTKHLFVTDRTDKSDIDRALGEYRELVKRENNPKDVPLEQGWSPFEAVKFLSAEGLEAGDYDCCGGDFWHASSPYFEIDDEVLANNVAYYVEGTSEIATTLKLVMNLNYKETKKLAHEKLLSASRRLCEKALGAPLPRPIEKALRYGQNLEAELKGKRISVAKDSWPPNAFGEYDIKFTIGNN